MSPYLENINNSFTAPRMKEAVTLLCKGKTKKEISSIMNVSNSHVRQLVFYACRLIEVHSTIELIAAMHGTLS